MVQSVDQTLVTLGDAMTYTRLLSNTVNTKSTHITFTYLLPSGTSFITVSVPIDVLTRIGPNPNKGIYMGG
ncbi:hypothetical protein, partial [Bacillus sp. S1-R2T1-FB]|uniref:hypothetical protein n=1 Tax=Bacillus sp. S1-R2T1-FB TaxID=1973493 RepID=UPI0011550208